MLVTAVILRWSALISIVVPGSVEVIVVFAPRTTDAILVFNANARPLAMTEFVDPIAAIYNERIRILIRIVLKRTNHV